MGRLIDDLLSYARVSEGSAHIATPVDTNVPLKQALENLSASALAARVTITNDPLSLVAIDATHLVQLFQNLVGNAIHYRRDVPPEIHISAVDQGDCWLVSCRDNGVEIDPEFQAQIFEPFKRLHGQDRPGSGIGLAVCKRIIERYKGTIWVNSQVNAGSTFFFTLPK